MVVYMAGVAKSWMYWPFLAGFMFLWRYKKAKRLFEEENPGQLALAWPIDGQVISISAEDLNPKRASTLPTLGVLDVCVNPLPHADLNRSDSCLSGRVDNAMSSVPSLLAPAVYVDQLYRRHCPTRSDCATLLPGYNLMGDMRPILSKPTQAVIFARARK